MYNIIVWHGARHDEVLYPMKTLFKIFQAVVMIATALFVFNIAATTFTEWDGNGVAAEAEIWCDDDFSTSVAQADAGEGCRNPVIHTYIGDLGEAYLLVLVILWILHLGIWLAGGYKPPEEDEDDAEPEA